MSAALKVLEGEAERGSRLAEIGADMRRAAALLRRCERRIAAVGGSDNKRAQDWVRLFAALAKDLEVRATGFER